MTRWPLVSMALPIAVSLAAQQPHAPPRHVVRGVVFDSVAGAPLAGAEVQVALRDSAGPVFRGTTDSTGYFRIGDLPSGRFVIGFYHDALTALGLDSPMRAFDLAADSEVTVDIGVPSAAVVRAARCGGAVADARTGMLAGVVRDAVRGTPASGTTVTVAWRAIALDPGNVHTVLEHSAATVGLDGTYRLCAVPADAPLMLRVTAPGYRSITGPFQIPQAGVLRQDLRLADSTAAHGAARFAGRVVHENGKPVAPARAVVTALGLDVPVRDGAFVLTDLPPGTWLAEVRSIGLEPRAMLFDAVEGETTSATITLSDRSQALEAVTVVGTPSRETKILDDVLRRQRASFGTVFLPGNVFLQGADRVADVLRAARGFTYRSQMGWIGRPPPPSLKSTPCRNLIAVYLNGALFPQGLEAIDDVVRVTDVLAVEAYPDANFAPIQWRISNGCAVVAVWTTTLP